MRSVLPLLLVLVLAGCSIGITNLRAARSRPGPRACFALQRGVEAALMLHHLEDPEAGTLADLSSASQAVLLEAGRLPTGGHPGGPRRPPFPFVLLSPAPTPACACLVHGLPNPPEGTGYDSSPRQQLAAAGITDPEALARASDQAAFPETAPGWLEWALGGLAVLAAGLLMLCLVRGTEPAPDAPPRSP